MNPNILFAIYCVGYIIFRKPNIDFWHFIEFIGYSIPPVVAIILYNIKKGNRSIENFAYAATALWMVIAFFSNPHK